MDLTYFGPYALNVRTNISSYAGTSSSVNKSIVYLFNPFIYSNGESVWLTGRTSPRSSSSFGFRSHSSNFSMWVNGHSDVSDVRLKYYEDSVCNMAKVGRVENKI